MISDTKIRMAEWIIKQACQERNNCDRCFHHNNCGMSKPDDWDIPDLPPEPTKRQRIEWMQMFPDDGILDDYERQALNCCKCKLYNACKNEKKTCNVGHIAWWHEVATLEQFRKDVGME